MLLWPALFSPFLSPKLRIPVLTVLLVSQQSLCSGTELILGDNRHSCVFTTDKVAEKENTPNSFSSHVSNRAGQGRAGWGRVEQSTGKVFVSSIWV